jgi:uncharacterized membrane protein HdeD (DUF308 family)
MSGSAAALEPRSGEQPRRQVGATGHAAFIAAAGGAIIILSIGAAFLPVLEGVSATMALGSLLIAAGLLEVLAGRLRHETRGLAMLAGAATAGAGFVLLLNRDNGLVPNVTVVSAWLFSRSIILLLTSRLAHGSVKRFLGLSAATDLVLGVGLLIGLSVTTLAATVFGPSPQLLVSYGLVLALSFLATGTLLLEVASCERKQT